MRHVVVELVEINTLVASILKFTWKNARKLSNIIEKSLVKSVRAIISHKKGPGSARDSFFHKTVPFFEHEKVPWHNSEPDAPNISPRSLSWTLFVKKMFIEKTHVLSATIMKSR